MLRNLQFSSSEQSPLCGFHSGNKTSPEPLRKFRSFLFEEQFVYFLGGHILTCKEVECRSALPHQHTCAADSDLTACRLCGLHEFCFLWDYKPHLQPTKCGGRNTDTSSTKDWSSRGFMPTFVAFTRISLSLIAAYSASVSSRGWMLTSQSGTIC